MADERKIIIELKAIGGDDSDEEEREEEEVSTVKARKKAIHQALKTVFHYAYNEITSEVFYEIGQYTSLSEDYKTQVLVSNIQTTVNKVKSLASSTISTAMLGAKIGGAFGGAGGPIGAAIGLLVGAGASVVSTGLELRRMYDQQNISLLVGDRNAIYAQSRIGLIDNGRGTQN